MAKLTYLSYTGYSKLNACAESWQREYLLKQRPPFEDQRNVLRGNALHNMMEQYILNKKNDPQWLVDNIDKFWDAEVSKAEVIRWKSPTDQSELQQKVRAWALGLARLFHHNGLDPAQMQAEFKADCNVQLGPHKFKMGGRIDVLMRAKDGKLFFLDLKGSENKDVVKLDQVVWYSILLEQFSGEPAPYGGYLLPGFPAGQQFPLYRVPQEARDKMTERIVAAIDRVKADDFAPTPEDKQCFWCPVKYACTLFGGAIEHKSGVVTLGGNDEATIDSLL